MVFAVARDGLFAHQLQQALGIDGGLDGLTHHAGGIVEAKVHITGRFQRTAQLLAQTGGVQAVGAQLHQILPARDIAAGGGDAAARVLMRLPTTRSAPAWQGSFIWVNSP